MDVVIEHHGVNKRGEIAYFRRNDAGFVDQWKKTATADNPNIAREEAHAMAALAVKRYLAHEDYIAYAKREGEIDELVRREPALEVGNFILLKFPAFEECNTIGICHFRRTWCNSVVLDYLASHPLIADKKAESGIRGAGLALVYFMSRIAVNLGSELIWGEATEISHGFYDHVFKTVGTQDLIRIPRDKFEALVSNTEKEYAKVLGV